MSTLKVNAITNVTGSGNLEFQLPLKLKEVSEPSAPSDGHGLLFIDSSDNALKYRHAGINSGNSVNISSAIGVALSSANTYTREQIIDGTTDAIQLKIQGHSTQSSNPNLLVVENSSGTDLFTVTNTGVSALITSM